MKATISSIYFPNIPASVISHQRLVVEKFLPEGWYFNQLKYNPTTATPHADALSLAINQSKDDINILLDVDCVPFSTNALKFLADLAVQGYLAGAMQRANHIQNNKHLYVGPFCMAFSKEMYRAYGAPSFQETSRGDAGEELTYRWNDVSSATGGKDYDKIYMLLPFDIKEEKWNLYGNKNFGYGTTFGMVQDKQMFYHQFCIREGHVDQFNSKCQQILTHQNEGVPNEEAASCHAGSAYQV